MFDHLSLLGQSLQFTSLNTVGILENPTTVDDADYLLLSHEYLVGTQVPIWPSSDNFGDILLLKSQLPVDASDKLSD